MCDDSWGMGDAKVACRMMGYPGVEAVFSYGYVPDDFVMDNVNCGVRCCYNQINGVVIFTTNDRAGRKASGTATSRPRTTAAGARARGSSAGRV